MVQQPRPGEINSVDRNVDLSTDPSANLFSVAASGSDPRLWLGLMIGNSHFHWARFSGKDLLATWDTTHWSQEKIQRFKGDIGSFNTLNGLPMTLASVVPEQTKLWQDYVNLRVITLAQVPLKNSYSTLGIDRALAVLGAGEHLGWPLLVIDAGTALTFTGVDSTQTLAGGAILPGLGLQLSCLSQNTSALPKVTLPSQLPQRWALATSTAIQSGVIYTILAGIQDFVATWLVQFPDSKIALTGGDAGVLLTYLTAQFPQLTPSICTTPDAIFWGMAMVNSQLVNGC